MHISVVGIGYVGAVTAACAARDGRRVIAVDRSRAKVDAVNAGRSPVLEPGLGEMIAAAVTAGGLSATTDIRAAIQATDLTFVCVGTPSRPDGSVDLTSVTRVAEQIGHALAADQGRFRSIVLRSTVPPGATEDIFVATLEKTSGLRTGEGFGVAYFPEFLREGTAVDDHRNPGSIVYGRLDDRTLVRLQSMRDSTSVTPFVVSARMAETVKWLSNAWHATKVSFANEAGNICKALGVDSHDVMDVLCSDTRLNLSRSYLTPGFAYGGSCLPKDIDALRFAASQNNVATPMLDAVVAANALQIEAALRLVESAGGARIGLIGLSFKPDTDDLRESPMVALAQALLAKGFELAILDDNVRVANLSGANLAYVETHLPNIATLMREDLADLVNWCDTLVLADTRQMAKIDPAKIAGKQIVDLVRYDRTMRSGGRYQGLCW